ncbi:MAG: hypothetical protein ACREO9_03775, partial [Lysobacterales bacterium]
RRMTHANDFSNSHPRIVPPERPAADIASAGDVSTPLPLIQFCALYSLHRKYFLRWKSTFFFYSVT